MDGNKGGGEKRGRGLKGEEEGVVYEGRKGEREKIIWTRAWFSKRGDEFVNVWV